MIIEHTSDGAITNIVSDPVPSGLADFMTGMDKTFLDLPPEPLPVSQLFEPNGSPILDGEGEPIFASPGSSQIIVHIAEHYVLEGEVLERPTFDAPESLAVTVGELITLPGLPNPVDVTIDGTTHIVEGGELELTADMPAQYTIEISQWPYISRTVEVTVNAAA